MLVIVVICGDDGWLCRLLLVGEKMRVQQIYDVNQLHCMSKVKEQAVVTELYSYQPHTHVTCYMSCTCMVQCMWLNISAAQGGSDLRLTGTNFQILLGPISVT